MKFDLKEQKRNILLGTILCALVACIGYSFAYFTAGVKTTTEGLENGVTVQTAKFLKITYDAGDSASININNAYPGMRDVKKEFSVNVEPYGNQQVAMYDVLINISKNTFTDTNNDLKYTLKGVNSKGESVLDQSGTLTNVTGKVGPFQVTHEAKEGKAEKCTYTLTISYPDNGKNQNHEGNFEFIGTIDVQLHK